MVFSVFNASGVLPTVQGLYDIPYRKNLMHKTTQARYLRPDTPGPIPLGLRSPITTG